MNSKILVAFNVLVFSLSLSAISLRADTLRLKNGQTQDGVYLGGNADSIQFRVRGAARTFRLSEVDRIQFANDDEGPPTGANQNMVPFTNSFLQMMRPADWQITDMADSVGLYPPDRRVRRRNGPLVLAYGATLTIDRTVDVPWSGQYQVPRGYNRGSLETATNQLITEIRRSKPNLNIVGGRQTIQVDGERALSTRMTSDSPLGGRETDWLITIPHPEGLIYILFNAPDWDFQKHESYNFRPMLDSVRLQR
jgi:hypothetical protein